MECQKSSRDCSDLDTETFAVVGPQCEPVYASRRELSPEFLTWASAVRVREQSLSHDRPIENAERRAPAGLEQHAIDCCGER
ncbi:MAG: hypothetical protein JWO36_2154 [Myxococcales bacterium]|nr:hypothetical protein [Myxococcales bacterium]